MLTERLIFLKVQLSHFCRYIQAIQGACLMLSCQEEIRPVINKLLRHCLKNIRHNHLMCSACD